MNLYEEILENKRGGRNLFLLGNEAVARGAIEAGISTATTYPVLWHILSLILSHMGLPASMNP